MHIKKLNKSEAIKILAHDKRENLNYSNEDIDLSKSQNNVIYQNRSIDEVLKGVKIHGKDGKAKDKINYCASVVVHYPKDCPISENEFFGYMNYVLSNKFGLNNVVCSVVHNDEKRSHMHFVFCPIVLDKDNNKKLCCKEVINKSMLQSFHDDIEKDLFNISNKKISLRNDESVRGIPYVDDIDVYKKLKDLENERNLLQLENNNLKAKNNQIYRDYLEQIKMFNEAAEDFNNLQDLLDKVRLYFAKYSQIMLPLVEEQAKDDLIKLNKDIDDFTIK